MGDNEATSFVGWRKSNIMTIGLPRALLYYYYGPFWITFFRHLDIPVTVSGATTKTTVDTGIKHSVAEMCLPVKVFCGHVAELIAAGADRIFIPRMMAVEKDKYFCPKFLGLPDMIRHVLPESADRILTADVKCDRETEITFAMRDQLARSLGVSSRRLAAAINAGRKVWNAFRARNRQGLTAAEALAETTGLNPSPPKPHSPPLPRTAEAALRVGLLGYVYNIYDAYIGMNIVNKLRTLGAFPVTFEMIDDAAIMEKLCSFDKTLPWTFSNKLLGAGYNLFADPGIDGLIHITAFGCGPDSMLGKLLELAAAEAAKPFITVRVDEHGGETHMLTRLEAFTDMLRRKNRRRVEGCRL